jgi:hypothetical protein
MNYKPGFRERERDMSGGVAFYNSDEKKIL